MAQISPIYGHKDIMIELRKVVKLVGSLRLRKPDELKYEQIMEKIRKHYQETSEKYLSMPEPQIKKCYVVYERIKVRNRVADLYRYNICPEKLPIKHLRDEGLLVDSIAEEIDMP